MFYRGGGIFGNILPLDGEIQGALQTFQLAIDGCPFYGAVWVGPCRLPVSSVIDSYRESTKNLSGVPKHADELLVYDNTAHRRGFRVVAQFVGGKLSKTAQTIPDWAAKVFGKEFHAAKKREKPGRGR